MRGRAHLLGLAGLLAILTLAAAPAPGTVNEALCQFQLGFAAIHDQLPSIVGDCIDNEANAANGDSLQHTTAGLLAWRKADNLAAFTDGTNTWVNGPDGIQERPNADRFPFEHDQLSQPALKLRLLDAFGPLLYCDPDFYPIARADEQSLALARFPQIQADAITFQAIISREGFDATSLTDAQKLVVYRDSKQLNALQLQPQVDGSFAFSTHFGSDRQGTLVQGIIDASGTIQVSSQQPAPFLNCPICLAAGTLIATPAGDVAVQDVGLGMLVWTLDGAGRRVVETVLSTGTTPAPATHQVVDLVLADGRELHASP
ncbi:MAG TPA: Hint domain-containing protein, partial [Chloroflexota bacterium]